MPAGWVPVEAAEPVTEELVSLAVRGEGQGEWVGDHREQPPVRTGTARGKASVKLSKSSSSVGRRIFLVA
ncbi:MAG TPA: hypothetical protein VF127_08615, partial [Nitrospira sp.]